MEIETLFSNFNDQIKDLSRRVDSLNKLLHSMSSLRNVFDEDDMNQVKHHIAQLEEQKQYLENEFSSRQDMYNKTILQMETALAKRQEVLDEAEEQYHVLGENKELVKWLAEKQSQLIALLEETKQKLLTPIS